MKKLALLIISLCSLTISNAQFQFKSINVNDGKHCNPDHLTACKNKVFFAAINDNIGTELWITDGTDTGTHLVKDINPNNSDPIPSSRSSFPQGFVCLGDKVYFMANDSTHGYELWVSDGTNTGTKMVMDIDPGSGSSAPKHLTVVGNNIFFAARGELWMTDGSTSGTKMVKDINPGPAPSSPDFLRAYNGKLIFAAKVQRIGEELWISDGTVSGTYLLKDIFPGSYSGATIIKYVEFNSKLYFAGFDGTYGTELWVTDGTESGTKRITDTNPGQNSGLDHRSYDIIEYNNKLYFSAQNDTSGQDLFVTDGTTIGTKLLKDIDPFIKSHSGPLNFHVYNNKLYFKAVTYLHYYEPWVTDGTTSGTQMVKDIAISQYSSDPHSFVNYGKNMFFVATNWNPLYSLYVSDGTEPNTKIIAPVGAMRKDAINSGKEIIVHDNALFFAAGFNSANELWIMRDSTIGVSVENTSIENNLFSISPNPAHRNFTIKTTVSFKQASMIMTDITGKLVLSGELHHTSETISLPDIAAGTYLIAVSMDGKQYTQRLILE